MVNDMNIQFRKFGTLASVSLLVLFSSLSAYGAPGTLPSKPLYNSSKSVDPNVFITTDDSGSMLWEVIYKQTNTSFKDDQGRPYVNKTYIQTLIPDWGSNVIPTLKVNDATDTTWIFYHPDVNKLYYNYDLDYEPWPGVDASGTLLYNDALPTAVRKDPNSTSNTKNIVDSSASNFFQPVFCTWVKDNNTNGLDETDDHKCIEIKDDGTEFPSGRTYQEEINNYANWMQYYRTRELAANNALGSVVNATVNARMGIRYINHGHKIDLISMSDSNNKQKLLDNIYTHETLNDGTPLRTALQATGEMFKDSKNYLPKDEGGECQQNFNILMTDGYWNGSDPSGIGNEDGNNNTDFDGGSYADIYSNKLADVAMYYYENDLISDDILDDKVPTSIGFDLAPHQHLVNYTVAFGLTGLLDQDADPTAEKFVWPEAKSNQVSTLDDLKHAAYNSRGLYLSADNPQNLLDSLLAAIMNITERTTIASAAAVTSSRLTTDSTVYLAEYNSVQWRGSVLAHKIKIDPSTNEPVATGELSAEPVWDAAEVLTKRDISSDPRTIITYDKANKTGIPFKWDDNNDPLTNAMKDDLRTYCSTAIVNETPVATGNCINHLGSIYCPVTKAEYDICKKSSTHYKTGKKKNNNLVYYCLDPDAANNGTPVENLSCATQSDDIAKSKLEYLRGDRSKEGTDFRIRASLLGDIVNSGPIYVQAPNMSYPDVAPFPTDAPYSSFKASKKSRKAVVYAGSNDGMFHAFDATEAAANATSTAGREIMAYIPSYLFSTEANKGLHYLSNKQYLHQFYNDLPATVADAYISSGWKTLLIGGQRAGGRGYFALDITTPENFSSSIATTPLWEFSSQDDADLGYSYSRAQVGMLNDGTWVTIFGNGYNSTGTGEAQLFVVKLSGPSGANGEWVEGTDYVKITTGASTVDAPLADTNGLGTPALADLDENDTLDRAYAGDLKGNLWVFDLSGGFSQIALAYSTPLFNTGGEPITIKPILATHPTQPKTGNEPNLMVYFGSGQFLIDTDPQDTASVNHFYGVWDNGQSASTLTSANLVAQTWSHTAGSVPSDNPVDYTDGAYGWAIQLSIAGERSITDAAVRGSAVIFNTTVPASSPCTLEGLGYRYAVDLTSGSFPTEPVLDLNNDNIINEDDMVTDGSNIPPVSTLSDFPTPNTFTDELVFSGKEPDSIAGLLKPKTGRLSWQELLK